jgi:hypothetical protein
MMEKQITGKQGTWLGKKAQAGVELGQLLAKAMFYAIFSFGILQLISFIVPGFSVLVLWVAAKVFAGKLIILLFIVGGCIGFIINEIATLLQLRQFHWSGSMTAALICAIAVAGISWGLSTFAPATFTQSFLLLP